LRPPEDTSIGAVPSRVLSAVGGSQRVDGLEAPLTGRDAELRTIKDLFHAAAGWRPRTRWCCWPRTPSMPTLGCWTSWTI
jgi:hypothetical protein